jgi:hypothetical protein
MSIVLASGQVKVNKSQFVFIVYKYQYILATLCGVGQRTVFSRVYVCL